MARSDGKKCGEYIHWREAPEKLLELYLRSAKKTFGGHIYQYEAPEKKFGGMFTGAKYQKYLGGIFTGRSVGKVFGGIFTGAERRKKFGEFMYWSEGPEKNLGFGAKASQFLPALRAFSAQPTFFVANEWRKIKKKLFFINAIRKKFFPNKILFLLEQVTGFLFFSEFESKILQISRTFCSNSKISRAFSIFSRTYRFAKRQISGIGINLWGKKLNLSNKIMW